jgi:hypothetical protein
MKEVIGTILFAFLLIITVGLIISWPVMFLWNECLVGAISGINPIGWLQAWGILILFGMLFKTSVTDKK